MIPPDAPEPLAAPGEAIYRLLLKLHPRRFRERYQSELIACLREAWDEEARGLGARAAWAFWARTVSGTMATAWRQRVSRGRGHERTTTSEESTMKERPTHFEDRLLDAKHALRGLRRDPGFTSSVLLTLGLSIGSATAVFSVVNGVLLQPLPYPASDRLHRISQDGDDGSYWLSTPNYQDLKSGLGAFELMGAFTPDGANMVVEGEPARVAVAEADADFFRTLDVRPLLGRLYTEEERAARASVAVVSHGLWTERMGRRADAIGSTLVLDGQPREVIGVLPPIALIPSGTDVWIPLSFDTPDWRVRRGITWIQVVGRLRSDVDSTAVRAEAAALSRSLRESFPEENGSFEAGFRSLEEAMVGSVRTELRVLMAAVALVLVVAAINVGGLLLARASARRGEVALRSALGGSRRRLAAQLLTESALLAALGCGLGIVVGRGALAALLAAAPPGTPRLDEVSMGASALLFALASAFGAALLFGVLPAFASLRDTATPLRASRANGGPGATRLRGALVVAQVALAVSLLFGAGLLGKSFWKLQRVDLGFDPEPLLVAGLPIGDSQFSSAVEREVYYNAMLDRVRELPGVREAALTSSAPFTGFGVVFSYELPDLPPDSDDPLARFRIASPELFATLGIPLLRGRPFAADGSDGAAPGAVVSEDLVRRHFASSDPIGRPLATAGDTFRIVGVVPSLRDVSASEPSPFPFIYVPTMPATRQSMMLIVRAEGDPGALMPAVRQMVRELAPAQPLSPLQPMTELISGAIARPRFTLELLVFFAVAAVVLSAIGLYGLLSYTVGRRTHEIGVRLALGAPERLVRAMVMGRGVGLAVLGAALGVGLALRGGGYLEALLYEVRPRDPAVLGAVAATLIAVAIGASWVPARRATRTTPAEALKTE